MPNTSDTEPTPPTASKTRVRALGSTLLIIFVDLLRRPSLTLASGALLATYLAKIDWYTQGLERYGNIKMSFMAFLADDLLFWSATVFVILLLESLTRGRWMRLATGLIAFILTLFAVANVFWLRGTGDQIHLAVVKVGINRTAEVLPILKSGLGTKGLLLLGIALLLPALITLLFRAKWRKDKHPERWRWSTAAFPLLLLLLAGWGWAEQTGKRIVGWRLIAANVHTSLIDELLNSPVLNPLPDSVPDPLEGIATPASAPTMRPNIVVVVLEATAHRATSLSDKGPPTTPFLRALAGKGLQATSMRTVLPHTSKSLFSIFCGRYPSMQHRILETADNYPNYCLPKVLKKLGYGSAFFQSADGRFEGRPRLVANMGFDKFVGWQDLHPLPPQLGYLAANDMALVKPALNWAGEQKDGPFFMGILTSASHHPYELPRWIASPKAAGKFIGPNAPQPLRYLALVHGADEMLRHLVLGIQRVNARPTIFVVTGDHGEAFGEHGGRQHDNIYTEEGLHVPFVLVAPGITAGSQIAKPRSLIDVAPTLLDLIKQPFNTLAFDGRSLLSPDADVPRYFSCWYDNVCAGKVTGVTKVVTFPNVKGWAVYDLATDADELKPQVESGGSDTDAKQIANWYHEHRFSQKHLKWTERKLYDGWLCPEGKIRCRRAN